jgi:hypothetical protein
MFAKNFLSFCIDFSEKMIFGNGDVFHTVSSLFKKLRNLSVRTLRAAKRLYPRYFALQKIKAYEI